MSALPSLNAPVHTRHGSVYVLVLTCAMLVMLLGLSGLLALKARLAAATQSAYYADARELARSAVDWTVEVLNSRADWRDTAEDGTWFDGISMGYGTVTVSVTDPRDGDFADDPDDPVLLSVEALRGPTRYLVEVELETAAVPALELLNNAAFAGGSFYNAFDVVADAPIRANANIRNDGYFEANGLAAGAIADNGVWVGTSRAGVAELELPDEALFEVYHALGTELPLKKLEYDDGAYYVEEMVLSPDYSPCGVNEDGIYYIDAAGDPIRIENVRIIGTLLILNATSGVIISGGIHWEPASSDLPALLVDGDASIAMSPDLNEALVGVNFNPNDAEFDGESDTDRVDSYESVLKGICFASGSMIVSGDSAFDGVLVANGNIHCNGLVTLTHDGSIAANPPEGFQSSARRMRIQRGTWRHSID